MWLAELEGYVPETTSVDTFVGACLDSLAGGYFLYDYEKQKNLIPNIITLAAVTGAVPIDMAMVDDLRIPSSLEFRYDLSKEWKHHTPLSATREVRMDEERRTSGAKRQQM